MTMNCPECARPLTEAQEAEFLKKQEERRIVQKNQEAREEWMRRCQGQGYYSPQKYYCLDAFYFFPAIFFLLVGLLLTLFVSGQQNFGVFATCLGGLGILFSIFQKNWKNRKEARKWLVAKAQFLKEKPDQFKIVFKEISDQSI